ncbi:MAG: flagellar M-ring protein FliF [Gammaproteobacteria bacterium]|nr:flagellar M-ring protein FliF [Gammaproteobacteria bacterium]
MAEAATFNAQASLMLLLRQVGVMVGLAAAVALGLYVALWARQPEYSVLFADLQDRDLNQVIEQLTSNNIPYRMDPNGGTVLVPADNLMTARMKLAGAGLAPTSSSKGAGFEALNSEQPFGTSQFLEQARYQHAIEGELSRSISHITNVRSARVHIAMPKQSAFARTKRDPSASVIVDLFNGRQLERHQVAAIAQMVSAAVAGMPVNQVTVVDQRGNLLTDNADQNDSLVVSAKRFEYTRNLEQSYIDRVEAILSPLVGPDGVRAEVTADLDFTESQQSKETYNPDMSAVRSESSTDEERSGDAANGVPGALSNQPPAGASAPEQTADANAQGAPGANGAAAGAKPPASVNKRSQKTKNYEVDRNVVVEKNNVGSIRRLSVAVVVRAPTPPAAPAAPAEGDKAAEGDAAKADGEKTDAAAATAAVAKPAALSEAEIERMTNLVKLAIGFDAARGDSVTITSAEFQAPPAAEPLPELPVWQQPWVWNVGKQVAGGLFVLFVLFGVIRPTVKSLMTKPLTVAGSSGEVQALEGGVGANGLPALAGPAGMDGQMALPNQRNDSQPLLASSEIDPNIDSVKQFVSNDPRVAAQVIKGWVGGE